MDPSPAPPRRARERGRLGTARAGDAASRRGRRDDARPGGADRDRDGARQGEWKQDARRRGARHLATDAPHEAQGVPDRDSRRPCLLSPAVTSFALERGGAVAPRSGLLRTAHGAVRTPAFMPVGTAGSVKGLSPAEIRAAGTQILLANTYHLMLRPGSELIRELGGLHAFMGWGGAILTDSGGDQGLRAEMAERTSRLPCDGFALGGLSLGEAKEETWAAARAANEALPVDRPRYLMGMGLPEDLLDGIARGVDLFDCVLPTRNARNGMVF